jgi:hypothetical protein
MAGITLGKAVGIMQLRRNGREWAGRGVLATLPLLCAAGCDAQVGDEYRGEPLLSMQGTVVLSDPKEARNVVPAIAFSAGWDTVLVEPELQGQFPAQFRLDVTEPPPPETLTPFEPGNGNGSIALGRIVVVPSGHPERIPALLENVTNHLETDDGSEYTSILEKCTATGVCLTRTLACKREPCELLEATPPLEDDILTRNGGWASAQCSHDACLVLHSYCAADDRCEHELRRCDLSDLGPFSSGSSTAGEIERCDLVSESGDPSIEAFERLEEVAIGYYVFYLTEPNDLGDFGRIPAGYHLIRAQVKSEEDRQRNILCVNDAAISAVAQYNREHGTDEVPFDAAMPDQVREATQKIAEELERDCPPGIEWDLISDPLARSLTLVIGREP